MVNSVGCESANSISVDVDIREPTNATAYLKNYSLLQINK